MSRGQHRFCLVNLGCPKNTVDSEGLLGGMALAGFRFVSEPGDADVCIVNTCGFLDASRREAAETLEELAEMRGERERPLLVAAGCLVERAGGEPALAKFLEAADAKAGFGDYARLPEICRALLEGKAGGAGPARGHAEKALPKSYMAFLDRPRMRIGYGGTAYLKIGEGCSNNCAYCSIPLIRGRRASRPAESILREARQLVDSGAREIVLIAQDTTAYGMDRRGGPRFAELLGRLLGMPDEIWFRVLYAHPKHLTDGILAAMASDPRVCPYLDLPLQHVGERTLKAMGRGYGRKRVEEALEQIRGHLPEAALRTTFIVGHPGETAEEYRQLLEFVEEGHFDHVGAFAWSPEPGTKSAGMRGRVSAAAAQERLGELMAAQAKVSARRLRGRRGRTVEMLLERRERDGWHGRTVWQAPEVDGETVLEASGAGLSEGALAKVEIVRTGRYDCRAVLARA